MHVFEGLLVSKMAFLIYIVVMYFSHVLYMYIMALYMYVWLESDCGNVLQC